MVGGDDPILAGLAAFYRLGAAAPADLSPAAAAGSYVGPPAPDTSPWGDCPVFSGSGADYFAADDGAQFDFGAGLTVALLVRLDGTADYEIATKALPDGTFAGWSMRTNSGSLDWLTYNNGGNPIHHPWDWEVGRWYHLAGTQDRTNLRLYIDGAPIDAVANAVDATGAAPIRVGFDNAAWTGSALPGAMVTLGIWRRALGDAEVARLAANPLLDAPADGRAPAPTRRWYPRMFRSR